MLILILLKYFVNVNNKYVYSSLKKLSNSPINKPIILENLKKTFFIKLFKKHFS